MHPGCHTKISILILGIFLQGCGETFNPNTEYVKLRMDSKQWLVDEEHQDDFLLRDSTEKERFFFDKEWGGYHSQWITGSYPDKTETHFEGIVQYFYSDQDANFRIELDAGWLKKGDLLTVRLEKLRYTYDLKYNLLTHVASDDEYKSTSFVIDHYEPGDTLLSTLTYHDTLTLDTIKFASVFHFTLRDFEEQWEPTSLTEIFIGKHVGLIGYAEHGGKKMVRKY
ncbi:MAG: hypothetical protein K9J30_05535 [Bacteroidales bacterium]|nr:hypothetical protein [Bacteroidales bacterium]